MKILRPWVCFVAALAVLAAWSLALPPPSAWSQVGPTVKLIVPFPAGGTADILARLLGEQIGKTQKVTIVVENRPGAAASIAYEAVARAAPDGNTMTIVGNSLVINPNLRKVNYDPITSFEPICHLVNSPQVIAVNSSSPHRTLHELVAAARAKPGEISLAGTGPGATQHIGIERFKQAAKAEFLYVPFNGGAPAVNALLGGHVTGVLQNYSEVSEQISSGKLRALATTSLSRMEPLPDVPTVAESGFKDYEVVVWFGAVAPAKTSKEAVAQLATWFKGALQDAEVKPKLIRIGLYPAGKCEADFAAHIREQNDEYARVIRDAKIKPE
jgi:tripartite-type tricarboxylate transporter receptor subunit TctC